MSCAFYLRAATVPVNQEDIKTRLSTGNADDRTKAVRDLVRNIIHDDRFPPMIMHVITNIIPIQAQSRELQKAMYLYWEVIDKYKSSTDRALKDQIFLACNSFRTDLLSHNQFVRGRMLRLISRIMHRGVIQPLSNAIIQNLNHKSAFVRRNAVVCLYHVQLNFGSDVIGEIDDQIQKLLKTQNDLSTKRNAFLLLQQSSPLKALQYIDTQIKSQSIEETGDILQLAILNVLRQNCKSNSALKPKLSQLIKVFEQKATQSVLLQCAITSIAINHSVIVIKHTLSIYCSLLIKTNEINVKKAILDRLQSLGRHSSYIGDDLLPDLINCLDSPSLELRVKLLHIIMTAVTLKSVPMIFHHIDRYLQQGQKQFEPEYLLKLLSFCKLVATRFPNLHQSLINTINSKLLKCVSFTDQAAILFADTLRTIFKTNKVVAAQFIKSLITSLHHIESFHILRVLLNILSTQLRSENQVIYTIQQLIKAVSPLPFKEISSKESKTQSEKKTKTVILGDGSYSSQVYIAKEQAIEENKLRIIIMNDCITGGVFVRALGRLLHRLKGVDYNKQAHSILLVLCSLYRHYNSEQGIDQAVLDLISLLIRVILKPQQNEFMKDVEIQDADEYIQDQSSALLKSPEEGIHFRLLHKDEAEEQVGYTAVEQQVNNPLKSIVQLTGWKAAVYAQASIVIRKCDVKLSVLLINNNPNPIQNVQIQFSSQVSILVLDKAECINLKSLQPRIVNVHLRFDQDSFGAIYGYINYDNLAGIEQNYIITQQIKINYLEYFVPTTITLNTFDSLWSNYRQTLTIHSTYPLNQSLVTKVKDLERELKAKIVSPYHQNQDYFLSCKLVTRNQLQGYILFIVSLFAAQQEIMFTIDMKFQDKPYANILFEHLKRILKISSVNNSLEQQ